MHHLLEFLALPLLVAVAALFGALEGKSCGHQSTGLFRACLRAFQRSTVATAAAVFLFIILLDLISLMGPGDGTFFFQALTTGLLLAPLLGAVISLFPAPIAAFIAYNLGARKRAEEEIARSLTSNASTSNSKL